MSSKKASRDKVQVASPLQINKNADSMTENSKDEHQKEVDSSKATTLSGNNSSKLSCDVMSDN